MLKFFTKRNYVYFDAISQAVLILKIIIQTRHQAGIFFAQL